VHKKRRFSAKNLALIGGHMFKFEHYRQLGLADFNQPLGFKMNSENRCVKKAATIPWDAGASWAEECHPPVRQLVCKAEPRIHRR